MRKRGRIIYTICLLTWLVILACGILYGLDRFEGWLKDYQTAYDASRPELLLPEYVEWFSDSNVDAIYDNLDVKPDCNSYESEKEIKAAMADILASEISGNEVTWEKASGYNEAQPEYYVLAGNCVLAHIHLIKNQETTDYGFPTWSFSYLSNFYCEQTYDIKISVPSNVTVSVNGLLLDEKYCYLASDSPDEQKFFGEYAVLPVTKKYAISDFYYLPAVTAENEDGYPASVTWNDATGVYEIDYGTNPDITDMENLATETAETFSGYLSNDVDKEDMLACFVPDCEIIDKIIAGREDAGLYFMRHTKIEYNNIKIDRMNCYNSETFACDVHMSQDIYQWKTEPTETNRINYRIYFVKTDDGWKACNFEMLAYEE